MIKTKALIGQLVSYMQFYFSQVAKVYYNNFEIFHGFPLEIYSRFLEGSKEQ